MLLGTVTGAAGIFLPSAFLCATIIAAFTAFTYAELVARLPLSSGEAIYVDIAFGKRWLTLFIGFSAVLVGIVSAATITSGFVAYFALFFVLDKTIVVFTVVVFLGAIAVIGISVSAWAATAMTLVEIAGLVLIVTLAAPDLLRWTSSDVLELVPRALPDVQAVAAGAFLAFYAFLGFEDMVSVAEEVREPRRNMPRAILTALLISSVLYLLVCLAAIVSVPIDTLAASATPLSTVAQARGIPLQLMAAIALVAITNGALIQIIKSSRILYGMAQLGNAPQLFAKISPSTRTPVVATVIVSSIILGLALWFPIKTLATLTSTITLTIFAIVNLALVAIKCKRSSAAPTFSVPMLVPAAGAALCFGLLAAQYF